MTAVAHTEPAAAVDGWMAPYRRAVAFEWVKYRTVRSTRVLTAVMAVALPLFAALVAGTGSLMPDDTILGASLLGGAVVAQVLAAALGALLVTSEFRTGTMRITLVAVPRRLLVLAAKSTIAAAVTFAAVLPSAVAAHLVGLAILDSDVYATGEPFPAVVGVALAMASIAVLGVGLGTLIRHAAGAMVAVVAVVFMPGMLAPLLGDLERWVGGGSLNGVMQKLVQSSDATAETVGTLGAWPSLGIVAVYTVVLVLAAVWVLRRRDAVA